MKVRGTRNPPMTAQACIRFSLRGLGVGPRDSSSSGAGDGSSKRRIWRMPQAARRTETPGAPVAMLSVHHGCHGGTGSSALGAALWKCWVLPRTSPRGPDEGPRGGRQFWTRVPGRSWFQPPRQRGLRGSPGGFSQTKMREHEWTIRLFRGDGGYSHAVGLGGFG